MRGLICFGGGAFARYEVRCCLRRWGLRGTIFDVLLAGAFATNEIDVLFRAVV